MYRILEGDVMDVLKTLAPESVDAIVTDPPYGLEFMGKEWDAPWKTDRRQEFKAEMQMPDSPYSRSKVRNGNGRSYGADQRVMQALQDWHFSWATEALRVLKPGGHLLAFGGSRTYHRLACAVEDAGFEIRDQIMWIYGSGFPKSLDVSKAIDKAARGVPQGAADPTSPNHGKFKSGCSEENPNGRGFGAGPGQFMWPGVKPKPILTEDSSGLKATAASEELLPDPCSLFPNPWQGWGTALKPAHEPIVVARKPLEGTVAANVLQHGTGALNIDGCRVGNFQNTTPPGTDRYNAANYEQGYRPSAYGREGEASAQQRYATTGSTNFSLLPGPRGGAPEGRWPANVIHDGSEEVVGLFPTQAGAVAPVTVRNGEKFRNAYGAFAGMRDEKGSTFHGDTGNAARFFYCAKADREERNIGLGNPGPQFEHGATLRKIENKTTTGNTHPTVKPLDLMAYLCRLVTPPGGTVLDLFAGSGTTGMAALRGGFNFIGIELNPAYVEIARRRLAGDAPLFNEEQRSEAGDELQNLGG